MSDLTATNCGGNCGSNNNDWCTWIILLLVLSCICGDGNGFGGFFGGRNDGCGCNDGFGCDGILPIIIILFLICGCC